jgi:hypothetical protein
VTVSDRLFVPVTMETKRLRLALLAETGGSGLPFRHGFYSASISPPAHPVYVVRRSSIELVSEWKI